MMQPAKRMLPLVLTALAAAVVLPLRAAKAFEFDTGSSSLKIRWDNTFKYSAAYRLRSQSSKLLVDVNEDDGDRNFDKGIISNRVDWLSELEANLPYGGVRLSSAAWYDQIYNQENDNDSPATNNSRSVDHDEFTHATRRLHGRKAELLDAFAYGKFDVGPAGVTLRAGRHSLVYGETLFFGQNGIADAQGPFDLVKLLTVPSTQFKEVLRPVEQVSGNLQLTPNLSLGAYYQFRWQRTVIPAAGSYLSNVDIAGRGAESMILAILPEASKFALSRRSDLEPKDGGQGGVQMRFNIPSAGLECGLYAARYHAKTPSGFYIDPVVSNTYRAVYAQNIQAYGASVTTSVGQLNVATEFSVRRHAPLYSAIQVSPGMTADNDDDTLLAVGNTAHGNLSGVYVLQPWYLWGGGAALAEVAWNRRLSISDNPQALDSNTTRDAWAARMLFEPTYFQVISGLDLSVPLGVGYNLVGRSSAVGNFNGGTSKSGDLSVGLNGTYRTVWTAGLNYVRFFGPKGTYTEPPNSPAPHFSFKQTLADRDFISFNIKRTF